MTASSLPPERHQRQDILGRLSHIIYRSHAVLSLLQDAEAKTGLIQPVVNSRTFDASVISMSGILHVPQINAEVREVATLAQSVLAHLDLQLSDISRINQLAASPGHDNDHSSQDSPLILVGKTHTEVVCILQNCQSQLYVTRTEKAGISQEIQDVDKLRIGVLVPMVQNIHTAAVNCHRQLERMINPPSVKDRVSVDREKAIVTLDDVPFPVTESQATLFFYLVEANGSPVSGKEIARKEGQVEFKLSRVIKHLRKSQPQLGAIIKKEARRNGRHWIDLRPLQ